ncbi:uncharacterized protein LOC119720744 [Patiria miniata]|uniref:Apical junction molecule ajm1 alpha/beta domain-containing protein n=1 Tax=Patiria miniata TaxID=46514 RepID=A0A913Z460_PATMI|nr:uncharacterized protein LOC119720744 [Patiria miniata]XP_038046502.1 uncharacterized protein LOC119720744 [Patiria miniata]XP_038046503.1 uncharacterized protein LOC119720744 [Patiria miniata]
MDPAGMDGEVAVTVSGVAPVTLIAQISVALIAVAVTAVYILKNLPDSGESSRPGGTGTGPAGRESPGGNERQCRVTSDGHTLGRNNGDDVDGGASTSKREPEGKDMPGSRGEYRDIISCDEYKDLCGSPPSGEKPRPARKKGSLSGQSKEWPTSLESIDEEDEEEEEGNTEGGKEKEDEPKTPKQSPKRGSRVPNWYFSKSSSGIPSLPRDRDLDSQFSELATQTPEKSQCASESAVYTYEDVSHVDEARKRAITGFSGTPIGVLQRKPWPAYQSARELNDEYLYDGQTSSQSLAAELDHPQAALLNLSLENHEKRMSVPDIQIHEYDTTCEYSKHGCGSDENDSAQWVQTLASTVLLPEKCQEELKAEIVRVDIDKDDGGENGEIHMEKSQITVRERPIPRPRTNLTGVSKNNQDAISSPSTPESVPPFTSTPPRDEVIKARPDIDQPPAKERAPRTGAKQPTTNANEGLHQQTKHVELGYTKTDAALEPDLQTRTGFIKKENIDSVDKSHNRLPSLASHYDSARVTTKPNSRVFTVVGSTPGPISTFQAKAGNSNGEVVGEVEIHPTPASEFVVTPPDTRVTLGANPPSADQTVTTGSAYENGTPTLSTELSSDESGLQHINTARNATPLDEIAKIDYARVREEPDTSHATNETLNTGHEFKDADSITLNSLEHNSFDAVNSGNNATDVHRIDEQVDQSGSTELDEIRANLTERLPLKRPKELFLNKSSKSPDSKPWNQLKDSSNGIVSDPSDSELSSATSPSDVVAQQRARIRKSLEKLNVPDWYKKSNHYKRVLSSDQTRDLLDNQSDSEPRMTRSPSSCLSDCWSATSSEETTHHRPAVSTKLAFQSEARYRRDFPKRLLYEPIRNAFSCAELPTQSSIGSTQVDAQYPTSVIDDIEIDHSAHDTLSGQSLNQTSTSLNDVNSGSPPSQSSPSHGLRTRSKSEGDHLDQITYFDSLAVKRLERHMYDSIFFVTGYINDSQDNLDEIQSDGNSLFASGSLPDESLDDMEYRRQMYELRESVPLHSVSPEVQHRPTATDNYNFANENGYMNRGMDTYRVPFDRDDKNSQTERGSIDTLSTSQRGMYGDNEDYRSIEENQNQWTPTPAPRRNIMESPHAQSYSLLTEAQQSQELKPDPRYNPDGSRNVKLSPRFAMVTPQINREGESPRSSPRNTSPRRTTVKIMVTDTSLEDDDSGPSTGHRSDNDLVSASSSDQETVVDGTTNSWTPLDLERLKDSEFAAVLSVITSRHMKPGNRSGLYLPGSGFIPPKEVTMEEIVDSLLGLPYQRAASAVDLNSSGYRGSSSTSTPLTCSTPDLSSSWSPSRGSTPVSTSDKSHSADSLYSEDGNVLNSIVIGRRNYEDSYHDNSYEEGGSDAIGEEIIMVKCNYKKCAKTKELAEARKSFKTCHNCYTYYCSRQCRKMHWPRHKKRCLFSRVNSACKHVIYHSRYNAQLQSDLTRVARTGYLSRGRGSILLIFPDTESAENYTERGFDALPSAPTYSTVRELETSDLFGDHMKFLLEMCRTYDPERKFVLNVAIMANPEQHRGNRPRQTDTAVKKCAKLSLIPPHSDPTSTTLDPVPDTLIITSPSGSQGDGELDRKSRQVCFVHIQRQLRQRGVNLRHQHAEIYDKLCRWVEDHEHFTPTTIYPLDERTGKRFMCVLMPEAEPDDLGWINNPELLEDIDLDAELEKLENVAGMVVTDL